MSGPSSRTKAASTGGRSSSRPWREKRDSKASSSPDRDTYPSTCPLRADEGGAHHDPQVRHHRSGHHGQCRRPCPQEHPRGGDPGHLRSGPGAARSGRPGVRRHGPVPGPQGHARQGEARRRGRGDAGQLSPGARRRRPPGRLPRLRRKAADDVAGRRRGDLPRRPEDREEAAGRLQPPLAFAVPQGPRDDRGRQARASRSSASPARTTRSRCRPR